jgi:hypothetical protein
MTSDPRARPQGGPGDQRKALQARVWALQTEIANAQEALARLHERLEAALDELALTDGEEGESDG